MSISKERIIPSILTIFFMLIAFLFSPSVEAETKSCGEPKGCCYKVTDEDGLWGDCMCPSKTGKCKDAKPSAAQTVLDEGDDPGTATSTFDFLRKAMDTGVTVTAPEVTADTDATVPGPNADDENAQPVTGDFEELLLKTTESYEEPPILTQNCKALVWDGVVYRDEVAREIPVYYTVSTKHEAKKNCFAWAQTELVKDFVCNFPGIDYLGNGVPYPDRSGYLYIIWDGLPYSMTRCPEGCHFCGPY